MPTLELALNVPWRVSQVQSGAWIGVCTPLKLTVQSDTYTELMEDILQTLEAMLDDLSSDS